MARDRAREQGAFYTPDDLAARVAALALDRLPGAPRVLDPACGDGALLAAAARRLLARGLAPVAVASLLHGLDRDADALAAARSRLHGLLGDAASAARLIEADGLGDGPDRLGPPFDVVVANPPFLSVKRPYLKPGQRAEFRSRFALAAGQFDAHGLFLERCLPLLGPGGRWAFVLPRPVLANRELAGLRTLALEEGALDAVVDAGLPFAAAVEVVVLAGGRGRAAGAIACAGVDGAPLPDLPAGEVLTLPGRVLPLGAPADDLALHRRLVAAGTPIRALFSGGRGIEAGKRGPAAAPVGTPGTVPVRAGEEVRPHRLVPPARALRPDALRPSAWKPAALHRGPKLLVRRVAPGLVAAVDPTDTPALNTLYLLHPRDGDPSLPYAAAAALGTTIMARHFAVATVAGDRIFPYVRAADLSALPLPPPGSAALARLGVLGRLLADGDPPGPLEAEADRLVAELAD